MEGPVSAESLGSPVTGKVAASECTRGEGQGARSATPHPCLPSQAIALPGGPWLLSQMVEQAETSKAQLSSPWRDPEWAWPPETILGMGEPTSSLTHSLARFLAGPRAVECDVCLKSNRCPNLFNLSASICHPQLQASVSGLWKQELSLLPSPSSAQTDSQRGPSKTVLCGGKNDPHPEAGLEAGWRKITVRLSWGLVSG